jgi:DNA primase
LIDFDLTEWVRDSLEDVHDSSSKELECRCPFCSKEAKFYINTESGNWICFRCGEKGRGPIPFKVIAQVEGESEEKVRRAFFRKAVKFKKRRKSDPTTVLERLKSIRGEEPEPPVDFGLPPEFVPVWDGTRWRFPTYLKERGFTRRSAAFWNLGFCETGRYAKRIIIPIRCPNGRSLTARDTNGREPKYLNPEGADHRRLVFGYTEAGMEGDVALVEGPLDTIKNRQNGIPSVGIFGKRLHPEQFSLLRRWSSDRTILVMLDPEAEDEAVRIAKTLRGHFDRVFMVKIPVGKDPGAMSMSEAKGVVDHAVRFDGDRLLTIRQRLGRIGTLAEG